MSERRRKEVAIPTDGGGALEGVLGLSSGAAGIVVFAHGSGSSRRSPRNTFVADRLEEAGLATLLFDLLTAAEDRDTEMRFDIPLLARRLETARAWVREASEAKGLPIGLFGSSTGAAAALIVAARSGAGVSAVVSRGGRPDLAMDELPDVRAPTRLIVGGDDAIVLELNRRALERLRCVKDLAVVPGATHLFAEPGALEEVARLAAGWFRNHLAASPDA